MASWKKPRGRGLSRGWAIWGRRTVVDNQISDIRYQIILKSESNDV